jgi:type VI secretion system protein ImpK
VALIDDFIPALAFASMLASEENLSDVPYATARADMDKLLDSAVKKAIRQNPAQAENALFAVCAFADEVIVGSNWQGRGQWLRHKLQQERFNTANAGKEFYERLSGLCGGIPEAAGQAGDSESPFPEPDDAGRDALEVYAACLTLGFKGKFFGDQGRVEIDRLTRSNLDQLHLDRSLLVGRMFPEVYDAPIDVPKKSGLAPGLQALVLFGVPALIAIGIYFMYSSMLSALTKNLMQAI